MNSKRKRVLAVASEGGHWVQLQRLNPAFADFTVEYMTTNQGLSQTVEEKVHIVRDANLWTKVKLALMFLDVFIVVARVKPDFIITTGAAPGLAAIFWGRVFGVRSIWIDSIANSESLSGSGNFAKYFATVCLTQWEHLAIHPRIRFWGAVL